MSKPAEGREVDIRALERSVSAQMDVARRRAGRTVEEIVELLSPLQPRSTTGTRRRQKWYQWLHRPQTLSAITFVYAGLLADLPWATEIMQARPTKVEDKLTDRVDDLEQEVAALRAFIYGRFPDAASLPDRLSEVEKGVRGGRGVKVDELEQAGG